MSMYPEDLKYNAEHTWLRLEEGNTGRVGITDFAQRRLKEVVFVELPEAGTAVTHMEPFGVIESVKATNDLCSPVSGEIAEVNSSLRDDPSAVNLDPYGDGWMVAIRLSRPVEVDRLLSATQYVSEIGE